MSGSENIFNDVHALGAQFQLRSVNSDFSELPEDIRIHITDKLSVAQKLLGENENIVIKTIEEVVDMANVANNDEAGNRLIEAYTNYIRGRTERFGASSDTTNWREIAGAIDTHSKAQQEFMNEISTIASETGLNIFTSSPRFTFSLLQSAIVYNNGEINTAITEARHPELPEFEDWERPFVNPNSMDDAIEAVRMRVISTVEDLQKGYDFASTPHQGIKTLLVGPMIAFEQSAVTPDEEALSKLAAIGQELDNLLEVPALLHDALQNGANFEDIENANEQLKIFYDQHLNILDRLERILDEHPSLSLRPDFRNQIDNIRGGQDPEYANGITPLINAIEANKVYIDLINTFDKAEAEPSTPSPTQIASIPTTNKPV